jgi:hypothetical protein
VVVSAVRRSRLVALDGAPAVLALPVGDAFDRLVLLAGTSLDPLGVGPRFVAASSNSWSPHS